MLTALLQDPGARFRELNPGYRERAGRSYEESNLEPASASLAKVVDVPGFTVADAAVVLKAVIYDFLDVVVETGGEMSRAAHGAVLAKADAAMKKRLGDEAAFGRWKQWRDSADRGLNPLAFLTSRAIVLSGLPVVLSEVDRAAGWTLRAVEDDRQAAAHQACFPFVPHQVLLFEKGDDRLALLVYRSGRAFELLAALEKTPAPGPRVFWRTGYQFLVFAVETGAVSEDLKDRIRRQLARQAP